LGLAHSLTGHSAVKAIALVCAVLALAVVFTYPIAGAVGLLVVAASIFHEDYFSWSVGPIQIHLEEVVFAALALVALVAPRRRTWGGAAGMALAVFLVVIVVAAGVGLDAGRMNVSDAFDWARPLAFYGSFWVVLRLFPDPGDLRLLLIVALVCGAFTGLVAAILQFAPDSLSNHLQGAGGQQIYTQAAQAGLGSLKRIRLPGLACSYLLFWWALLAALAARGGRRALLWTVLAASATNIALSFNRNMWLGLLFGLSLMIVLAGLRVRHRLLAAAALGLTAVVLTFAVVGAGSSSQVVNPILARATTVLTPSRVGEESSLRDRAHESIQAWHVIEAHPLLGVGAGADFGVRFNHEDSTGVWVNKVQRFLHDQWLWLLLIGGVPALLAYLTFLGIVLAKAWGRRTRTLSQVALGVGIAMVMLSAFVMPYLGLHEFALMIGFAAAAIVRSQELRSA
jgi:hypothetical protein